MIGANCPRAIEPHEFVWGSGESPYAFRTALGWCVVGPVNSTDKVSQVKCNRIRVDGGIPDIPARSLKVKDVYADNLLRKMYELDFSENSSEKKGLSVEDERFLAILSDGVERKDGHYTLPLPFRSEVVDLPENRAIAEKRCESIKGKMTRNPQFKLDYTEFMESLIEKGYAKESGMNSSEKKWFIPHHGVYHPTKGKFRVVFYCAAIQDGRSLNKELLAGPDMTNSLLGVLLRFRKERIPYTADIEAMFYPVSYTHLTLPTIA